MGGLFGGKEEAEMKGEKGVGEGRGEHVYQEGKSTGIAGVEKRV